MFYIFCPFNMNLNFWCLSPLSAILQLYHGNQFQWWRKPEYQERTTDPGQATGKLYHLRLRVECTLFCNLQSWARTDAVLARGPGGSMSQVVGLPNNSYKPITNTSWARTQLCKLQKGCTRLAAASDKVNQLLAQGQWFSLRLPPPLKLVAMIQLKYC